MEMPPSGKGGSDMFGLRLFCIDHLSASIAGFAGSSQRDPYTHTSGQIRHGPTGFNGFSLAIPILLPVVAVSRLFVSTVGLTNR